MESEQARGRPRDPRVDDAIIDAYERLVIEQGRDTISRERVARRAGVGVASVYRRYGSMEELQAAAAARPIGGSIPTPDTGDLRQDLRAVLDALADAMSLDGAPRLIAEELAVMSGSGLVRNAFSDYLDERLRSVRVVLGRGVDRAELPADLDLDVLTDVLRGALYHRLLLRGQVPDKHVVEAVLDIVDRLRASAPGPGRRTDEDGSR